MYTLFEVKNPFMHFMCYMHIIFAILTGCLVCALNVVYILLWSRLVIGFVEKHNLVAWVFTYKTLNFRSNEYGSWIYIAYQCALYSITEQQPCIKINNLAAYSLCGSCFLLNLEGLFPSRLRPRKPEVSFLVDSNSHFLCRLWPNFSFLYTGHALTSKKDP